MRLLKNPQRANPMSSMTMFRNTGARRPNPSGKTLLIVAGAALGLYVLTRKDKKTNGGGTGKIYEGLVSIPMPPKQPSVPAFPISAVTRAKLCAGTSAGSGISTFTPAERSEFQGALKQLVIERYQQMPKNYAFAEERYYMTDATALTVMLMACGAPQQQLFNTAQRQAFNYIKSEANQLWQEVRS